MSGQKIDDFEQFATAHPAYQNDKYKWSINDFDVAKKLGSGQFGQVFFVREKITKVPFALKCIRKERIIESNYQKQMVCEIEIHSRLKHKHIIQLYTFFHDEHRIYMLLEMAFRGELYKYMRSFDKGQFPEWLAAKYIYQVSDAVIYIHAENVIHRDIKPENILLDVFGNVKLADFGWSVYATGTRRITCCGTVDYLPPEIIKHGTYDPNVDLWCIGIMCYELLNGLPPFEHKNPHVTHKMIVNGCASYPDTMPWLAVDLVSKLLVLEPSKRLDLASVQQHPWILKFIDQFDQTRLTALDKKATYLKIVEKHLNYENERERKFKTQTETFIQKNQSKSKKQPLLMPGKVNWTRLPKNTGLSMKLIGGSKPKTFKFVHSHSFQKCQQEFLRGIKKMDVGIFEAILVRNPFHIEAIFLLSELYKLNKDLELSVELVERGLHYMEHVLHPMFSLTKSKCSLPFKYRENRAFFILLFKHVLNVSRQSLYRTALELTKLILALDMTDPLAVVLFLDYYAIRSGEFRWLLEFYEAYDEEKKLRQLPNFANDQLMKAIVQYPQTVFRLLEKCNYDINKCLYQVHVFKNDISCPKSLTNLIDLYVHRNVSVWRDNRNQLLIWLESVLLANFDDLKSLLPHTSRYATLYKDLNDLETVQRLLNRLSV